MLVGLAAGVLLLGVGIVLAFDLKGLGRRWMSSVDALYGFDRGANSLKFVKVLGAGLLLLGFLVSLGFLVALLGR
ncbi:hypothetical protein ACFVZH_35135 [Streptomyces sp. NPDC059534]|uniref:hypothetical protein n=1 Tax=Streptomyces sp. NPDC059534 TaxID=3346859 RepID=UPI0036BA51F9